MVVWKGREQTPRTSDLGTGSSVRLVDVPNSYPVCFQKHGLYLNGAHNIPGVDEDRTSVTKSRGKDWHRVPTRVSALCPHHLPAGNSATISAVPMSSKQLGRSIFSGFIVFINKKKSQALCKIYFKARKWVHLFICDQNRVRQISPYLSHTHIPTHKHV